MVMLPHGDTVQSQDVVHHDKVKLQIRLGETLEIALDRPLASVHYCEVTLDLLVVPGVECLLVELGNRLGDAGIELIERQRLGVVGQINLLAKSARDRFTAEVDDHADLESERQYAGCRYLGEQKLLVLQVDMITVYMWVFCVV